MASYEKRENGKWSVRFRFTDSDSVEKYKRLSGFNTKKEAIAAYEKFIADDSQALSNITLNDLIEEYLTDVQKLQKHSTIINQNSMVNKHIIPFFKNKLVKDIRTYDIMKWRTSLMDKVGKTTVKSVNTLLSTILDFGYTYHDIPNIMKKMPILKFKDDDLAEAKRIWTTEQFYQFDSLITDPYYHSLFLFLFITGCRRGEALALTWDDIDFEQNLVHISKTMSHIKNDKGEFEITAPKTKTSRRDILVPKFLMDDLKKNMYPSKDKSKFVFTKDGRIINPNSIQQRFKHYLKKTDLPEITIHGLRHSRASILIGSNQCSIVAVSKYLGHSDINITLKTYAHMLPNDQEKIVAIIEENNKMNPI